MNNNLFSCSDWIQSCRSGKTNGERRAEEEEVLVSAGTMMVQAVNIGSDTGHCVIGVMSERCLSSHSNVTSNRPGRARPGQARPGQAVNSWA